MAVHISGRNHWLLLLDGANGKIYTYDLDSKQWMTPWLVTANSSCLNSWRDFGWDGCSLSLSPAQRFISKTSQAITMPELPMQLREL
jgi:hypothetical protein